MKKAFKFRVHGSFCATQVWRNWRGGIILKVIWDLILIYIHYPYLLHLNILLQWSVNVQNIWKITAFSRCLRFVPGKYQGGYVNQGSKSVFLGSVQTNDNYYVK